MSEITLRKIVDELGSLRDPPNRLILFSPTTVTGTGAGAASTILLGVIPYRSWRVVNCGFVAVTGGASTVAEEIGFGILDSDMATDQWLFASFIQDVTAGEQVAAGDCYRLVNDSFLAIPLTPSGAGTPGFTAGQGFFKWYNKTAAITIYKKQVASSTATVYGWVLIEIGEV